MGFHSFRHFMVIFEIAALPFRSHKIILKFILFDYFQAGEF